MYRLLKHQQLRKIISFIVQYIFKYALFVLSFFYRKYHPSVDMYTINVYKCLRIKNRIKIYRSIGTENFGSIGSIASKIHRLFFYNSWWLLHVYAMTKPFFRKSLITLGIYILIAILSTFKDLIVITKWKRYVTAFLIRNCYYHFPVFY